MPLSDLERAALQSEFTGLLNLQLGALERATYVGMNAGDKNEYDNRARRITEIQSTLGVAPLPPSPPS